MKFLQICTLVLAFVSATFSCFAQTGGKQKEARPPIVIKATRMFDGKSDRVVSPGLVIVVEGKIQAVGGNAPLPAGAEVIDLGDATLLPGFMDAHTHLSGEASDDWKQDELDSLKKTVAEQALDASVHAIPRTGIN